MLLHISKQFDIIRAIKDKKASAGKVKMNTKELLEKQEEERADARHFIMENIEAGTSPMDILDDLASFYDGDITDLF